MIPECCALTIPDEAWRQSNPGGRPSRLTASVTINGQPFLAVAVELLLPFAHAEDREDISALDALGVGTECRPPTLQIHGRDFVVYLVPEAR